jgi:YggT family protein
MEQTREHLVRTTTTSDSTPVVPAPTYASVTPTQVTTERVEQFTEDPGAMRRNTLYRMRQAIWLILAFSEGLLAIRFILRLLGANPVAGFAQFIYGITTPLIAPFVGLFGTPRFEGSAFEFTTLVAMIVYALLAWVIVKVTLLLFKETQSGELTRWTDTPVQ